MINTKTNAELLGELDGMVSGHIDAKKQLINLINRSRIRHYQKFGLLESDNSKLTAPGKLLLIGGSGTGKTYLVQCLQKILHFPLLIIDANKLNPTGASGGIKASDINQMIIKEATKHLANYPKEFHSVEGVVAQMIIFVDEIDKLGTKFNGSDGNWNQHVQANFLTIFENAGDEMLSHVSFIFAGAFTGMEKDKVVSKDLVKIGFNRSIEDADAVVEYASIDESVIKFGLLAELVGRISAIVELDKFTEQDYYDILVSKLIPTKVRDNSYYSIDYTDISEELMRGMATKAHKSGQGVRSLKRALDIHFSDLEFDYEARDYKKETIDDYLAVQLKLVDEGEEYNGCYTITITNDGRQ